ncbi:MAG: patatin-like phospholipase family protein [Actinomycetota bacterium]|nr:patatin-like phospholipase family protein [Actinomycetota bacterium]
MGAVDHPAQPEDLRADLVFEGGGVKGIGLAGAYRQLSDKGYQRACVAGTSAGAIMASLVAAGYTGAELQEIVMNKSKMDFTKFEDSTFLHNLGPVGDVGEFLTHRGIRSGNYFLGWIRDLLAAKGKTKFGDLRNPDTTNPKRTYKLQVIASDLSARSMLVLPQDAAQLGTQPDDLDVAQAVRMSMSIPVFFKPVTARRHVIVDGGLLSNFPIWLFDTPPGTTPVPHLGTAARRRRPGRSAAPVLLGGPSCEADRLADLLPAGDRRDDDGGPRSLLRQAGQLCPDDPNPHQGSGDNRIQHLARPSARPLSVRQGRGQCVPGHLELRRVQGEVSPRHPAHPPADGGGQRADALELEAEHGAPVGAAHGAGSPEDAIASSSPIGLTDAPAHLGPPRRVDL